MQNRVRKLERALTPPAEPAGQVAVIEEWSTEPALWADIMATDAANDPDHMADLVEQACGIRPVFGGDRTHVVLILDADVMGSTAA